LLKIKTWGKEWKRPIHKTNEWAAWQWANAKINKESFAILKQIVNIPKENMEDYHWMMFTCHGFFSTRASFKRPILEHFFTSLLNDLLTKDLVTLGNLLLIKFLKPRRTTLCNSK
jgi:hypothetical protein